MSTSILKALPGKLDIKRHSPSILYLASTLLFFQPTTLQVVPPIMVLFAKHPKVNDYDLLSVNRVVCGAAPLSPEIEEAVKNKLNLKYVQQGKFGYCIYGIVSGVCNWHFHIC